MRQCFCLDFSPRISLCAEYAFHGYVCYSYVVIGDIGWVIGLIGYILYLSLDGGMENCGQMDIYHLYGKNSSSLRALQRLLFFFNILLV